MGFYDEAETAEIYVKMAEGYDAKELLPHIESVLPHGATILELGMGPGSDLELLTQRYTVTASDNSHYFIERYKKSHPDADLLLLDAITLETTRTYDAIYSNKVLHHFSDEELAQSFERQYQVLNRNGYAFHTIWSGDRTETIQGLIFHYRTLARVKKCIGKYFEIIESQNYEELEPADSFWVLIRKIS